MWTRDYDEPTPLTFLNKILYEMADIATWIYQNTDVEMDEVWISLIYNFLIFSFSILLKCI